MKADHNCAKCELHKSAQIVCCMGEGPIPCNVMIIGEAPTFRRKEQVAVPFSGESGKLLDRLLTNVGLDRRQCYITNVVHYHPPENRSPTTSEIKACMEYLLAEIDEVKPRFVLLLGAVALKAVLNKSRITQIHGTFIEHEGITYMPTFHPAAALRDPSKIDLLKMDLVKFVQAVNGHDQFSAHKLNWKVIDSTALFNECIEDLKHSPAVSFDLETSDLNPFQADSKIHCIGLGTAHGTQWILPISPLDGGEPKFDVQLQHDMINCLIDVLKDRKVVGHNAKFDNKWLRVIFGKRFPLTFDTMLAAHLLNENIPVGLKYLAKLHFNAPDYDLDVFEKRGQTDPIKLYKYCAYDVYFTMLLYKKFRQELIDDPALKKVFLWLLMPASDAFEDVEINGVYVNEEKMEILREDLQSRLKDLEAELERFNLLVPIGIPQTSRSNYYG